MCAIARNPPGIEAHGLIETLRVGIRDGAPRALCVAFSGGPDSTALLHALSTLPGARASGLRAVHVDHGLHPDSAAWAQHCERFCAALDVPIAIARVAVKDVHGEGLEAAARHARFAAFAQTLRAGEWLALAQHRDDQVETVLLKLLRGAGPHGLGGMHVMRPFARGFLWRPLLDLPGTMLREYVAAQAPDCIADPSNRDTRLSRNFLRSEILPRLSAHWPQAARSITHAAGLCRDAADELDALVAASMSQLRRAEDDTLDAAAWSALPEARRALALASWLHARGLPAPTHAQCGELRRQIDTAQVDRVPLVAWPGAEVRVWRNRLHAMRPLPAIDVNWQAEWDGGELALPAGTGTLSLRGVDTDARPLKLQPALSVHFRRGGECIRLPGDAHTRELRDLFQRDGVPPWQRDRLPLIFTGGQLLAAGDRWLSRDGLAYFDARRARPIIATPD